MSRKLVKVDVCRFFFIDEENFEDGEPGWYEILRNQIFQVHGMKDWVISVEEIDMNDEIIQYSMRVGFLQDPLSDD